MFMLLEPQLSPINRQFLHIFPAASLASELSVGSLKALLKREDLALHYSTMLDTTPVSWFGCASDVLFWVHLVHRMGIEL